MDKLYNKLVALICFACLLIFGPVLLSTSLATPLVAGIPTSFLFLFSVWLVFIICVAIIVHKSDW